MGQYEENRQRYIRTLGKGRKSNWILILVILLFASFIVLYSAWNAITMEKTSRKDTIGYVEQITEQVGYTVDKDIQDRKTMIQSDADSLEMLLGDHIADTSTDEYLGNYLQSKMKDGDFEYIIFLRSGRENLTLGKIPEKVQEELDAAPDSLSALSASGLAEERGESVAYVEQGSVVFAAPVIVENETLGVLCGGRSYKDVQELIAVKILREETHSCVVTRSGELLLASGDDQFLKLKSLMEEEPSEEMQTKVASFTEALANGESGIIRIEYEDGDADYLSYSPLSGENWMLLTLIPTNIFSSIYTSYMERALLCAVGAAAVFLILVTLLIITYRGNRKKLEELAFSDEITHGINNIEFQRKFSRIRRHTEPTFYSIVMLDIHDFKLVNESSGFYIGDKLLKLVYEEIYRHLNEDEMEFAARSEMDHFFICMKENTPEGIQRRIDEIIAGINTPEFRKKYEFHVEFSQGACIVDDYETEIDTLQDRARIARSTQDYSSLNQCVIYTDSMERQIYLDRNLDRMADASMENHDFKVFFQPKVSMAAGKVKGAEALVRWQHPEKGLISPGDFIPVLEQSGRIQKLDRYVFEEVCRWLSEREKTGKPMFPVSVNLSRTNFWKEDFLKEYVAIADQYHTNRDYVEFELTETVFMEDARLLKVKEGIDKMHEYGFRCSVDDFGVGYSSLSLVNEMDVDILKFDRSFFTNLTDRKSRKIVRCLMNMAQELNLGMVVEGIETQDQIDFLMTEKCDVVQGYFYSRPLPEEEFNAWVDAFEKKGKTAVGCAWNS